MKILFVSHDASRSGAPKVVLYFLEWLSRNTKCVSETLCLQSGELVTEFFRYGGLHLPNHESLISRFIRKICFGRISVPSALSKLCKKLAKIDYDIIYANTVISIPAAVMISKAQKRRPILIAHVHEGYIISKLFLPDIKIYSHYIDRFIAASELVKNDLIRLGINRDQIEVVYEFSEVRKNHSSIPKAEGGRFRVGGSGHVNWRKGVDLFISVASSYNRRFPEAEIEFVWIGNISEHDRDIFTEDLRKASIKNLTFMGEVEDPSEQFDRLDLFLMTSREDPFPLVCIEVAQCGVPIVCFAGATGTEEIVSRGNAGQIVPYIDIESMAGVVNEYFMDRELLHRHGKNARTLFSEFTPERICPHLFNVIKVASQSKTPNIKA